MKILKTEQVKEADEFTINNEPITSIDLMERAAKTATEWILLELADFDKFTIFAGIGNNGGDGLVIARLLSEAKKTVKLHIVEFSTKYSEDFQINLKRLKGKNVEINYIKNIDEFPNLEEESVIIDAIFGSGLTRPVTGFAGDVIKKINEAEKELVVAIDVPSGLLGEENHHLEEQNIIKADVTLTFEFPFLSFLFAENENFVGEFIVIPIGISPKYISSAETDYKIIENEQVATMYRLPKKFSHKGTNGHGLLIAGGYGRMGAAILAAKAAHRSGIGLLTAHIPKKCVDIMQISSPETLLSIDENNKNSTQIHSLSTFNAIGIGPALGFEKETEKMLKKLLKASKNKPLVIDADAITIISKNKKLYNLLPKNCILTPHPKEFERLVGKTKNNYLRLKLQKEFSIKYKVIVVLKGANTSVSLPNGKVYFNPTGNPGMATGGTGDVLTGIILGLLAQGYTPEEAAIMGVYLHGLAGDEANIELNTNSIIASDLIFYLDKAFDTILSDFEI
ncbi:MAG: NAD(P)H-hydrate dehydratase [Bacteroidales bacterium]|nr:NAD(P)H-hydrate dehydratase [Bacteroidales bacterium]